MDDLRVEEWHRLEHPQDSCWVQSWARLGARMKFQTLGASSSYTTRDMLSPAVNLEEALVSGGPMGSWNSVPGRQSIHEGQGATSSEFMF